MSRTSQGRTADGPRVAVGEVAYLTVVTVNETGAFLDWGGPKDLLLPYGEQRFRPDPGKRVLVMVREDAQGRPIASMRLDRFLQDVSEGLASGDEVELIVAERTDLGYKAVVDHRYWGLLYHDAVTQPLRRGQRLTGYVSRVRDDGRLDLALMPPGAARLDVVGDKVLAALRESGGYLPLSDKSSPEAIKARLGVSKSAFKQAIGRLYKRRLIVIEEGGIRRQFDEAGD
ncbi:S1-like domain-containing RNA-binding protein [Halomonas sp. McH1-25]|uniref:CvfB family protein n=1 Tax=unclassified Halomonas TaxID=2609666 RepID=UPI001EF6934A|nr:MULTISPECIES: S1-like domain-containing RNA-binding protein [unclassified Halomonas]MCG7599590.1 S1-like domain-containing RNA-binding protein [Halomonas sp. McH1-25]MCP1342137.1 S1-like domain-containing RNA-binding protein [Halomonas sp. FL8]MCP1362758.1 S1-like domain-containing RNA-binding protein [Halomonas sp. BBD45]